MWCLNWDWIFSNIVDEYQEVGLCAVSALWLFWNMTFSSLFHFYMNIHRMFLFDCFLYKSANKCFENKYMSCQFDSKSPEDGNAFFKHLQRNQYSEYNNLILTQIAVNHFHIPSTFCPFSLPVYCLRFLVTQLDLSDLFCVIIFAHGSSLHLQFNYFKL